MYNIFAYIYFLKQDKFLGFLLYISYKNNDEIDLFILYFHKILPLKMKNMCVYVCMCVCACMYVYIHISLSFKN